MTQTNSLRHRSVLWSDRRLLLSATVLILVLAMGIIAAMPGTARATACQNLISNGDMESSTGWEARSNGTYSLFSDYQVRSGSQAAYMAGVDNAEDSLIRPLNLPADQTLTLTFWWLVSTQESTEGWDGLSVLLADANGNPLRVLFSFSNQNASTFWQQATVDISEFAGQSVQLQFNARTDGSLATDFFVDDVSVTACGSASGSSPIYLPILTR